MGSLSGALDFQFRRNKGGLVKNFLHFWLAFLIVLTGGMACTSQELQGESDYPSPRFPGFISPPETIEDILPFARSAVRQTGGRTPLGLVQAGKRVALFAGARALVDPNPLVLEAIIQAFLERGVEARVIFPEPEGQQISIGSGFTSEMGFREVLFWLNRFADPEEPRNWLKEKDSEVYDALFPAETPEGLSLPLDPQRLQYLQEDPRFVFWGGDVKSYLDQHGSDLDHVFAGLGGRTGMRLRLGPHGDKFLGNFIFDNYLEVMNKVPGYPGDIWRLTEERTLEPLAWTDLAEVKDPEGTDFSFEVSEPMARMWMEGSYQQGHLFMFPHQASGRRAYSIEEYPRQREAWNSPVIPEVDGILAGTRNHTGFYPRLEVHVEKGRVKEVKGGGIYGRFSRHFLEYPKLQDIQYPYYDKSGYWFLYESGMGTNPKFFSRPDELMSGRNTSERNVAGVIHWAFGVEVFGEPAGQEGTWERFTTEHNVPDGHWIHIHNLLPTYRTRIRGTETWLTLIEKGRLTALDHAEIRALAARYGDPEEVLRQEWVPDIPGITSPGDYQEYAREPWATQARVLEQIEQGTYPYLTRE